MKKIVLIILLFVIFTSSAFAESTYVLPYPSAMPGSKLYVLQELKDAVLQYWYFGNFGQFTYHLKQSDKYLVEAKTLFEYEQYLLASKALGKSDIYFKKAPQFLENAKQEGKNISEQEVILQSAAKKHIEILEKLKMGLPKQFIWRPEKKEPVMLQLHKMIDEAIALRKKIL